MTALAFHEYANLFPLIEGTEFFELAEDIRARGLLYRIDLLENEILDGRNRYRALVWLISTGDVLGPGWGTREGIALEAGMLAIGSDLFRPFNRTLDGDPLGYVLSKNLRRRHLDESQRAMVAARVAGLSHGGDRSKPPIGGLTAQAAAMALNVGERSVERAKTVQRDAAPEIAAAVDRGHLAVSAAAEIAELPIERQAEILKNLPRTADGRLAPDVKKALGPVIAELRAEKVAAKRERRAERELDLGRKLQALPEKSFGVAIEDFEWDHAPWSRETGVDRHPSMHYETAADAHTPEEIVARCAERFQCLAVDCVIFKWVTNPHLAIGIKVLELQGFTYVTNLAWNKERAGNGRGPGYWFTGEHELVLVGARGKAVPPATAHFRSNFSAAVGEHSEKPGNLHEIVEFHWPTTPKIEFNARRRRDGWASWGHGIVETMSPVVAQAIPGEASGTAREAPSTRCERGPSGPDVGTRSAPPTPSDDPLELPAFLRRVPKQAELDLTRRAPPEIVDQVLQMRLPLTADEIELHAALTVVASGEIVEWSDLRNLVGAGFVHATAERLVVTEEGHAFLAQLVAPPAAGVAA